jgi:hypothetical protein
LPPPSTPGLPVPTSTSTVGGNAQSGPCPVTQPVSRDEIPTLVVDGVLGDYQGPPVDNIGNWYGNDALWVELPAGSTVVKRPSEELAEKFPWVRLVRGYIRIAGQRLDGPAPPARGEASTGNGPIGFNSSGISFLRRDAGASRGRSPATTSPSWGGRALVASMSRRERTRD